MGDHSDRIKIAEEITKIPGNHKIIVNVGIIDYYVRQRRSNSSSIIFTGKGITQKKNIRFMNNSKCILDI